MFPRGDGPFYVQTHSCGHGWMWVFPLLFVLLLGAGLVWAILRTRGSQQQAAPVAAAAVPVVDPAIAEARMRYARGELSREQYLQAEADLRGDTPPPPAPPAAPPAE